MAAARNAWGKEMGDALLDFNNAKLILGGLSDANDLDDLSNRLLRILTGQGRDTGAEMADNPVLVAPNIGPAEMLEYGRNVLILSAIISIVTAVLLFVAVRFLLFDHRFPRSVAGCLAEMRTSILRLPEYSTVLGAVEAADRQLRRSRPAADDGVALDAAMDEVQLALARLNSVMHEQYVVH